MPPEDTDSELPADPRPPLNTTRGRIFDGPRWSIDRFTIHHSDGSTVDRDYIVHPGSVIILPLLDDGRIVMIRNWRHSVHQHLWELPAGTIEPPDEDPRVCADRELTEETGYTATMLTPLLSFFAAPGMADEYMRAYTATGLTEAEQNLDAAEHIIVEPVAADETKAMIEDGRIQDSKTIATLLYWHTFAR